LDKLPILSTTAIKSPGERLRILIVINLEWNPHLGAVRIYMELAERWRAAGHMVEQFSLSEAFPNRHRSVREFALRRFRFGAKSAAFIKKNGARFDVVDALVGSLACSKTKLGFDGLLVARSVGSHHLYDRFERSAVRRWPRRAAGSIPGKIFYGLLNRSLLRDSDSSVRHADLINVPNEEEAKHWREEIGVKQSVVVQPYGLAEDYRRAISQTDAPFLTRLKEKKVTFVGMWSARKGAEDWGEIVRRVRQVIPESRFSFLGTMVEPGAVSADLKLDGAPGIETIPEFSPADLPRLLSGATVGGFPSYVEGFGLALLEQLAAGIPTVAFDADGPKDILRGQLADLLVPVGDIDAFTKNLIRILQMDPAGYAQLVEASVERAQQFSWSAIAEDTLRFYQAGLQKIRA
jgi:glycosyltransferase involved in cell wall biosynthesis